MTDTRQLTVTIPLRWRDIDTLGHLNQSVYHELLEEARIGLITELVRRIGVERVHGTFVVRRVELDYLHEVRRDHEALTITTRVTRVGDTSITLGHDLALPDGTVAARGTSILVGWDGAARGKRTLSDAERTALGELGAAPAAD